MPTFGRVLTAMASPMHPDRSLDLDGAARLAAHLADHGSDGVVVCGTTGESPTLTHRETLDLYRTVVDAVGERVTVVAGTGKNDTDATVALTREATALGVDAVMLVTPYYNKPSQRGLLGHFTAAARATELPVLLYNIPARTGCEIAPATVLRLAEEVGNVRGVKDAVGDLAKTSWLAARKPDDFDILCGDDALTLPMLAVGGIGVVSVGAHLVGDDVAQMVGVFDADPAKAREIHLRLLPLFSALFADSSPAPLKAGLRLLGLPAGPVRPPLADVDADVEALMASAMRAAGLSLPEPA